MEPAFYRGDLLFLTNPSYESYRTGDITVYKIPGADIPIVHRVLETHDTKPTTKSESAVQPLVPKQLLLTKGDNNYVDDIDLYQGLEWLERKHIVGKVRGYVFIVFFSSTRFCVYFLIIVTFSFYDFRFVPYVGYVTIAMVSLPHLPLIRVYLMNVVLNRTISRN